MKSLQKRRSTALILAVVWLAVCLVLTLAMGQTKATEDYDQTFGCPEAAGLDG